MALFDLLLSLAASYILKMRKTNFILAQYDPSAPTLIVRSVSHGSRNLGPIS